MSSDIQSLYFSGFHNRRENLFKSESKGYTLNLLNMSQDTFTFLY